MRSYKKVILGVAALLLVGGGCVARQQAEPAPREDVMEEKQMTVVKVGVMVPLSGGAASYGTSVRNAVELAKKELELDKVELVVEDSKCEGKDAAAAVTKLITVDKVVAVIGELCSGATLAAAPIAEQNKVVLISPASTAPTVSEAGEFIFRTVPSDASQGAFGAELVYGKGYRKLAVLFTNDDYGVGFNDVLAEAFPRLGGEVVASEAIERTSVDARAQLTKIKAAQPDALYIISNAPDTAAAILKQAQELELSLALFGAEGLKSDDVITAARGGAEGMYISAVSGGSAPFAELHRQEFSAEPGPFAAQAYDAMQVLAVALRDGAGTGEEIRDALYDLSLVGVSGQIDFDQNGDISGNYDVFVVRDGKFVQE